mgnify:CR=1 FL=1
MIIFFFHNWLTTLFINVIHFSQCLIVQLYSILISKTGMLKRLLTWIKVSYNIHLPLHYNLLISQIHSSLIISFLLFLLFFLFILTVFYHATAFNGDISYWEIFSITTMNQSTYYNFLFPPTKSLFWFFFIWNIYIFLTMILFVF